MLGKIKMVNVYCALEKVVYRKYQQPTLRAVYFKNGEIVDEAADVVFLCGDGGRVKGHKVILATQYELLATVFNDQVTYLQLQYSS